MIVQTAPEAQPSRVIPMTDHLSLVDQMAEAFGNEDFAGIDADSIFRFAIRYHDQGWEEADARMPLDPETGLPCNLLKTPLDDMIQTGPASVDFNEAHHPLCGLLISMHVYGLFNGRYGLSDKIVVEALPPTVRPRFEAMLQAELDRQARLKAQLAQDPELAEQAEDGPIFHHYKLLQFFDTLALYFCMAHAEVRTETTFQNVPRSLGDDVSVTVTPLEDGSYRVQPFPFTGHQIELDLPGHVLAPQPSGTDIQATLAATPKTAERIRLQA